MIYIFYHKPDCDGHCSGAIAQYAHRNYPITLIPFDYDMPFPEEILTNLGKEDMAYFLDIVPKPYDRLYEIAQTKYIVVEEEPVRKVKHQIVVIDHHKTWIESGYHLLMAGNSEIGKAGCELTWEYFFPNTPTPLAVHLLGRYDVWDKSDIDKWTNQIVPFQYGMRLTSTHPKKDFEFSAWDNLFKPNLDSSAVFNIINTGKILLQYQDKINRGIMSDYSYESVFEGKRALCVNTNIRNSQVFESLWNPNKHDIMLAYTHKNGKNFSVSVYTTPDKGIDVSQIAKKYGGGGHAQAAGFLVTTLPWEPVNG